MKCEIIGNEKKWVTPKFGDYFTYSIGPCEDAYIYRVVSDVVGDAVFKWSGESRNSNHICYAEVIKTGLVVSISNPNIILLEQVEPAKFKVKE